MSDMDIIVKCNEKTLLQNDVTGLELIFLGYLTPFWVNVICIKETQLEFSL